MDMSSTNGSSGGTAMTGSMDMSSNTTNISSMNGSTMPHMGVMHSYFFASPTGQFYYLFESLYVNSAGGLVGACIFTVFLAAACQVINVRLVAFAKYDNKDGSTFGKELLGGVAITICTGLHYILMLLAMSFNAYVFVCVIVGSGIGHMIDHRLRKRGNVKNSDAVKEVEESEVGTCHP